MTAEEINKVLDKIAELSQKLAEAGSPLLAESWRSLVHLTFVEGIRDLIIGLFLFSIPTIFFPVYIKRWRMKLDGESSYGDASDRTVATVSMIIIACLGLIVGLIILGNSLPALLSPEGVTLRNIIK